MRRLSLLSFAITAMLYLSAGLPLSSLYADDLGDSGYYGFLLRLQAGGGYGEFTEDFAGTDDVDYYGTGALAALQLGWAYGGYYAFYIGVTHFVAINARGPQLQEVAGNPDIDNTQHDYEITSFSLGFSWLHPGTGIYISPEFRLGQQAKRKREQGIRFNPMGVQTLTTTEEIAFYAGRSGAGVSIGKERWFTSNVGIGVALSAHYDSLLLQRVKTTITTTTMGVDAMSPQVDDETRPRNSTNHWIYGFSIGIIIN